MARVTKKKKESVASGSVDHFDAAPLALAAAIEEAGQASLVGPLVAIEALHGEGNDGDHLATYLFEGYIPGYVGWRWAVTVSKVDEKSSPTICDVVLLPGVDALLPPPWLPYSDRVTKEDIEAGTIAPASPEDTRLVPSLYLHHEDGEFDLHELFEFGAGRNRVLSIEGRDQAVSRWLGRDRDFAKVSPNCGSCGFFIPIAGSLRQAFGVCANAISPQDAQVVSIKHGCGAHSEAIN
jgi:hypothetical protein